jgi:hypothetical protein
MKTVKTLLLMAAFVMPIFFASCGDDDDDQKNHFKYDGETYEMTSGVILNWGQWWGEGYNFDLYLFSEGIQYNGIWDITGTGHGIFFEFYSPNENELAAGTYNFDPEDEGDPFTFSWSDFVIDYDIETETGTEVDITGGTVEIEKSGSTYTIEIDAVAEGGKAVTGYYKGTLPVEDMSEEDVKTEPAKTGRIF